MLAVHDIRGGRSRFLRSLFDQLDPLLVANERIIPIIRFQRSGRCLRKKGNEVDSGNALSAHEDLSDRTPSNCLVLLVKRHAR
jgi:hypothetical protein